MPKSLNPLILVVDDRIENLQAISRVLRDIPVELHLVTSGQKALNYLVRYDYALAILDVQMPGMTGFELADLMSHYKSTEKIPIIFVTALNKAATHVARGYASGAVDYLSKPFDPDILIAKTRVFLQLFKQREALSKLAAEQDFILKSVNDGWWQWYVGKDEFFNSSKFKEQLGYSDYELENMLSAWQNLLPPEALEKSNQLLCQHLKNPSVEYHLTLPFRHQKGHTVWLLSHGICINPDEENRKIVGIYMNVSPIKNMEENLRRINDDLEQFAYIASHDLRAPLRAITSLTKWIESDNENQLSENSSEYFQTLITRVNRLENLITGILDYSRVSCKKERYKTLNLNQLLSNTVGHLNSIENCDIQLANQYPKVVGIESQIQQIFSNLIDNAIKYSDKAKIKISIEAQTCPGHIQFCVKDNGPGIDEAYHEKIFTLFKTLQPRDTIESTGVGLALVKKIVELNGGQIWLESSPREGCEFYFTWPVEIAKGTNLPLLGE